MIRLRQVTLVAADRHRVVAKLCKWLGVTLVSIDQPFVPFVSAGPHGEGIDAIDVVATNRSCADEAAAIGGVEARFV